MNAFNQLFDIKVCLKAVYISIVSSLLITLPLSAASDTGACVRAYVANRFPLEAIYNSKHEGNAQISIRNHLPTPVTAWIVGPQGELFYAKTIDGYVDVTSSSSSCESLKPCQAAIDGSESPITGFSNGTDTGSDGLVPIGSNYLWLVTDTLSGAVIDARVMASSMNFKKASKPEQNVVNYCLTPLDLGHGSIGHYEPGKKNVWHIIGAELPPPNSIGPPPVSNVQSPIPNQGEKFLTGGSYLGSYKEEISTMGKKDTTVFDKTKRQHFLMHYQSWYLSPATISLLPGETRQYIEEISRGIQGEADLSFQYSASLGLSAEIPLGDVPLGASGSSGWSIKGTYVTLQTILLPFFNGKLWILIPFGNM